VKSPIKNKATPCQSSRLRYCILFPRNHLLAQS
jgi:hypothetical protein